MYLAARAYGPGPRLVAVARDGTRRVVIGQQGPEVRSLVFDAGRLVVATDGAVVAVDAQTGAVTALAETPPAMTLDLALDGGWIYGATVGDTGGVFRVPCGGGALAWLHRGRAARVAARDGRVVFAGDGALFLLDPGAAPRALAPGKNPHALALVGDELVWTEFDAAGVLGAVHLVSGERRTIAPTPFTSKLVLLDGWAYVTQSSSRKTSPWIVRFDPASTAAPEPLVKGRCKHGRLAGGFGTLAWIDDCDGGAYAVEAALLGG